MSRILLSLILYKMVKKDEFSVLNRISIIGSVYPISVGAAEENERCQMFLFSVAGYVIFNCRKKSADCF